jgi:hypothetical protein
MFVVMMMKLMIGGEPLSLSLSLSPLFIVVFNKMSRSFEKVKLSGRCPRIQVSNVTRCNDIVWIFVIQKVETKALQCGLRVPIRLAKENGTRVLCLDSRYCICPELGLWSRISP